MAKQVLMEPILRHSFMINMQTIVCIERIDVSKVKRVIRNSEGSESSVN